ncbi:hypothetical protein HPB49_022485 [Dermacentor silvarum]|uniref:Uncharacterized protein n=1 Tax=Dermacentor silvarum TaxID=543639 RepID=A0ACB8E3P5_DERSI|nr:hypothetical protein HPB49_022485 [Dermacentor silvarum]
MPQLPGEHSKIIIRPRGVLNLNKVSTTTVGTAVIEASGLTQEEAREDVVCPNFTQNIIVVSTPKPEHAAKYVRIKSFNYGSGIRAKIPNPLRRTTPSKRAQQDSVVNKSAFEGATAGAQPSPRRWGTLTLQESHLQAPLTIQGEKPLQLKGSARKGALRLARGKRQGPPGLTR